MSTADPTTDPSPRGIATRLFLTCWLAFGLFFATNVVREHYLAFSIGDSFSFRLDEYGGLHPDLFEKEGYGWHIGNNPGGSMIGAIPYAVFRPVIDRIVERVQRGREAAGQTEPPEYDTPLPMRRAFYAEAWRRGLDVKLALGALVTQLFGMAPFSALGVVLMFLALRALLGSDRKALWLALAYAFATPVFYRTGFLNHNLMLGHVAFFGLVALWNPAGWSWSEGRRFFLAGLAAGGTILLDYSGVVAAVGLALFGLVTILRRGTLRDAIRPGLIFSAGALIPILILWWYQWRSFGHPFLPGQHWMPPVQWIERGYQGYGIPQPELLWSLLVDHKYGLFVSCPLFLLAAIYPLVRRRWGIETAGGVVTFALLIAAAFWVFFAGSNYTRLQWNTGIRYMAATFPFLFLPAALVLLHIRRRAACGWVLVSFVVTVSMCMYRNVAGDLGVLDPIVRTFVGGFQLPALLTLSRMGGNYGDFAAGGVSPLPAFALAAAILFGIWSVRLRGASG